LEAGAMSEAVWTAVFAVAAGAWAMAAVAVFRAARSVERHVRRTAERLAKSERALRKAAMSADRLLREAERGLRDVRPLSEAAGELGRFAAGALRSIGPWSRRCRPAETDPHVRRNRPVCRSGGAASFSADRGENDRQGAEAP